MKTVLHITLITLLLSAGEMHTAQPAAPPKAEANGNQSKPDAEAKADAAAAAKEAKELSAQLSPSLPPRTTGLLTPMEEFGLRPDIGDITVTRVRNPLGQLALNKHLLLSRRLNRVSNPWEELAPGTAVVVDGRKAVIVQIEPPEAPKDVGATNLRVTVRAKEIGGPELSLIWQQELQLLNNRVEVDERREILGRVQRKLRVGSHLIVNGDRVIITAFSLIAQAGAAREANPPHTLKIKYSGISSPHGNLTGTENRAESGMEPTWHFKYTLSQGGAKSTSQSMADESVRMVTWSFKQRSIGGQADPDGVSPNVIIIHRRRGLVTRIEAPVDDPTKAHIEAQFSFDGRVLTRNFDWTLSRNAQKQVLWQLKPHPSETYLLMYAVNDPNIRFQVTPTSLIEANERARASLKTMRNIDRKLPDQTNIENFNTNTVKQQLRILDEIYKSDASQVYKSAVKRKMVITLAQRYERLAIHHKALANEQGVRAEMEINAARHWELNAWINLRKADYLGNELPPDELVRLQKSTGEADLKDLDLTVNTIAEADRDVAKYLLITPTKSLADMAEDYVRFFRRSRVQGNRANELRTAAAKRRKAIPNNSEKVTKYFQLSLKLWQEYILRSEGLQKEERGLVERGLINSPLPADPLIPEILLRQGWIYRQLRLNEKAVQTFYGVLASSLQQEVFNLVRLKRINLVAKSQIANTYFEAPQKPEDYTEAIEQLRNIMMQPPGKRIEDHELDLEQVQLRYMRALYKAIRAIDIRITRDNRRVKSLKGGTPESNAAQDRISDSAKDRNEHWRSLAAQSARFIEQYTRSQTRQNVRYDGEVRYYKILAHQALGNEQHVQREVEVLLQNSSVSAELEQVWADTRLQIIMDIANLLYTEAIQQQADLERITQIPGSNSNPHTQLQDSVTNHLNTAIKYYQWARDRDQSYRSQILLRQQLAFAHERLGNKQMALNYLNQITRLFDLHPNDLTPILKLVEHKTKMRRNNLKIEIEQLNKSN